MLKVPLLNNGASACIYLKLFSSDCEEYKQIYNKFKPVHPVLV